MKIECNKKLFAAYCGLVAAGYGLTDAKDRAAHALALRIRASGLPEMTAYFEQARTGQIDVNPYYPRGSDLAAACFFLDRPLSEYLDFLERAGSPEARDAHFTSWIAKLPRYLKEIESCGTFPALWAEYRAIAEQRRTGYRKVLCAAQDALDAYGFSDGTELIFSPSLLQAPCLADYVRRDGRLYLIAARCTMEAALHESLHGAVRECRAQWKALLAQYGIAGFVDPGRMQALGYTWHNAEEGWLHALEDGIVRGLTAVLAGLSPHSAYARANREAGFLMVSPMIRHAQKYPLTKNNLPGFIAEVAERLPDRTI